jgi:hypothetical protein
VASGRAGGVYEAVIKVRPGDPPQRQARDIAEGIGYACALLADVYCWRAEAITDLLERTIDDVYDADRAARGVDGE